MLRDRGKQAHLEQATKEGSKSSAERPYEPWSTLVRRFALFLLFSRD